MMLMKMLKRLLQVVALIAMLVLLFRTSRPVLEARCSMLRLVNAQFRLAYFVLEDDSSHDEFNILHRSEYDVVCFRSVEEVIEECEVLEMYLTRSLGIVKGPSGNETWYNLNMLNCVRRMHRLGFKYPYWIRDDGVKMFGDYVMVAANLHDRPLGTVVETSLGTGIVVDTGDFVTWDRTRLDIAVDW